MAQSLLKRQRWLHSRLTERRENGEEGFTLIELLIVLLIIGILLAIAIPTYLSVVGTASTNTALTNLQTAITAGDTIYVNSGASYPVQATFVADLGTQADGITWENAAPAIKNTNQVSVDVVNSGEVTYAAEGSNSTCFYVDDVKAFNGTSTAAVVSGETTLGTYYASGAAGAKGCTAPAAAITGATWSTQAP